ncbi:MAG: hypothetical protein ACTTIM_03110 [Campylobacter sp.]
MQDFNGEIDFSKLKVAKKQPKFAGTNGVNFTLRMRLDIFCHSKSRQN